MSRLSPVGCLLFGGLAALAQAPAAQTATTPAPVVVAQGARRAVDPAARYYRLICLFHITGSGKPGDAVRPEYVPVAANVARDGILGWSVQLTDDKKMAIVHLAAANRHAFDSILADKRPEIRVFEIGKDSRAAIEAEMQKYKAGFDLSKFELRVQ